MNETQNRITTEALVIKEMKLGESDRLVTLFTRDYGIIRAFAAGAANVKSRRCTATSLLTYSSFTIVKKKDRYRAVSSCTVFLRIKLCFRFKRRSGRRVFKADT